MDLHAMVANVLPHLDERAQRIVLAELVVEYGYEPVRIASRASSLRLWRAVKERKQRLAGEEEQLPPGKVRREGGGRKSTLTKSPEILGKLLALVVDGGVRGDPERPLLWTLRSTHALASELTKQGHPISAKTVSNLLQAEGFSLQANQKRIEGKEQHEHRDDQFQYINQTTKQMQAEGCPVISVDTKKKELVGNFANKGQVWRPKGSPHAVLTHDFSLGEKAVPYGVYDVTKNTALVNVGKSSDTGAFSVASIRTWYRQMGQADYPTTKKLFIVADSGGSNAPRGRLWRSELQQFADETGLEIHVSHLPPGTSKWNKIEHRLFSHISMNWRGRPLESFDCIVNLIASTTTRKGLSVTATLDPTFYPKGVVVPDSVIRTLSITRAAVPDVLAHWNYVVTPRSAKLTD